MAENLHQLVGTHKATERLTVGRVFLRLLRHPSSFLLRRWNWKSATLSCLIRGSIFFTINSLSSLAAATSAMLLEVSFLSVTAGFYGAFIQAFRKVKPDWAASLTVMLLLPATHHALEFFIHSAGGTKKLSLSILASAGFSALSACFNLFTMRRGVLIVGNHQQSFRRDLAQLPEVIVEFLCFIPKAIRRRVNPAEGQTPAMPQGAGLRRNETPKGDR